MVEFHFGACIICNQSFVLKSHNPTLKRLLYLIHFHIINRTPHIQFPKCSVPKIFTTPNFRILPPFFFIPTIKFCIPRYTLHLASTRDPNFNLSLFLFPSRVQHPSSFSRTRSSMPPTAVCMCLCVRQTTLRVHNRKLNGDQCAAYINVSAAVFMPRRRGDEAACKSYGKKGERARVAV